MPKKKETIKEPVIQDSLSDSIDDIWDVVNEMQKNLDFINAKLEQIMNRMGIE